MEWIRFLSTFLIKNEWNAENAAASLSFASVVARTTDTQCLIPYSLRPKFKSQSHINIWDLDVEA